MSRRRSLTLISLLALAVPVAAVVSAPTTAVGGPADRVNRSNVVLDWEETAFEVVYLRPPTPSIPLGVPYLGFTSMAMHHAAEVSLARANSSEVAAVAVAAFHVLAEYVPADLDYLLDQKAESLDSVPDGDAKDIGRRIGRRAARDLIASRVGDGRELSGKVVYQRAPEPGVWQPPPGGVMAAAHLGYVDRLVLDSRVPLDGPDPLDSDEYAEDFNEVMELGSNAPPADEEAEERQETATFFNSNSALMVGQATVAYLRENPLGLRRTALLFAAMHGSMTDSLINAWRLKYHVGFWRPSEAIHQAGDDDNPGTEADPSWQPFLANPPYSDYVSGHASLTAPAVQVVRVMLGERTQLELVNLVSGDTRTYDRLTDLEHDAFHARIWGGLHFRDAMDDGYELGHVTADRVMQALGAS